MVLARKLFVAFAELNANFFEPKFDHCFCEDCCDKKLIYSRGRPRKPYKLPKGFVRIALRVDEGFACHWGIFENWHVSFHGTRSENVKSIIVGGKQLLFPGLVAIGGGEIGIREGHIRKPFSRTNPYTGTPIHWERFPKFFFGVALLVHSSAGREEAFDPNQVFTSPSPLYASGPVYTSATSTMGFSMKFMFQCLQRPDSYGVGPQTVTSSTTAKLDPDFDDNCLEWYTKETSSIVLTGVLVRATPV